MSKTKVVYPLDEYWTSGGAVYVDDTLAYCCTLNQTDLETNKNKFYIMQLIKTGDVCNLFIRYGRIGEPGKQIKKVCASDTLGKKEFAKQYKTKTGNVWNCGDFTPVPGKYFQTDVKYEIDAEPEDIKKDENAESKLDKRVQHVMSLFSNKTTMNNMLIKLEIDTKKLPLGKISKKQLDSAQTVLMNIKQVLDKYKNKHSDSDSDINSTDSDSDSDINSTSDSDDTKIELSSIHLQKITDYSSKFYTLIPYSSGRRKPPLIDNFTILGKYMEMIEEMKNIEVAIKVTKNINSSVDDVYNNLDTDIMPIKQTSKLWETIATYISNTHATTHKYSVKIVDMFEINRKNELPVVRETMKQIGNIHLLWHGSRMTNFCSILKNGLILNPETLGVYITGKMFSSGIYTANAFSKSFNYCAYDISDNIGALLLCEVALGKPAKRLQADYYITKQSLAKEGCHSTWGAGKSAPATITKLKDIVVPNGKLCDTGLNSSLLYDEFVVYDMNQVSLKYLVIVKKV